MTCAICGGENPAEKRFCGDCGAPLGAACPSCGAENPPDKRFCGDCGTALGAGASPAAPQAPREAPVSERRLVTVLFADLVGFTPLSESRDPEEVRELLSRYFDTTRRLIELYGGTVEKFIGDAVMAVWGTPVATEDDAERAVRAGSRPPRRGLRTRRRGRRARAPGACGRAHRRGGRHARRDEREHGRGRSREHRRADPSGRRARHAARR